jgi:hypothetical protein
MDFCSLLIAKTMDLLTRRINAHRIHFHFPSCSGKGWVSGFGQPYSAITGAPVKPAGPCNVPHAFKPNDIRIVIEQDDLLPSAGVRHLVCRSQADRVIRGAAIKQPIVSEFSDPTNIQLTFSSLKFV